MFQLWADAPFKPLKSDICHGGKTIGKKGDPSKHQDIGSVLDSILALDMPQGEWVGAYWSRVENLCNTLVKKTIKQLSSPGQASASDVGDQITTTTTATAIKKYDRVHSNELFVSLHACESCVLPTQTQTPRQIHKMTWKHRCQWLFW